MDEIIGTKINIQGIVQGVGFRPFIYNLANQVGVKGWVQNTSAGVEILVDGSRAQIDDFIQSINEDAPPLARIDQVTVEDRPENGFINFKIKESLSIPEAFQPISPDVGICEDCRRELLDPTNRRYRYPFINCTNCGPRFTIIKDIPYDRPATTMSGFQMCSDCITEYRNPSDRRFHAQPIACPECGPKVWLEDHNGNVDFPAGDIFTRTQDLLKSGKILAIKGLGGFHIACDANNSLAVTELRQRKKRVDKPFAVMMSDLETVIENCFTSEKEMSLLQSHTRPVVLLERREGCRISREVAPGQNTIGVMLPYTPLHHLLFQETLTGDVRPDRLHELVMTSANISDEPIAYENDEARIRLSTLVDAWLMHDRPIFMRCDDSVIRVIPWDQDNLSEQPYPSPQANGLKLFPKGNWSYPIRRSRGFAPNPLTLPWEMPNLLACGGELKNTFCLTRGHYAFLSHHIGDLENYETYLSFEAGIRHFEQIFRISPEILAHDLHPDYLSTRYAVERGRKENRPTLAIQHHHAHIAACMAENNLPEANKVIGIAFDGTGYGEDGAIWGGEILLAGYGTYERVGRLVYVPMPGGEKAIKEPWRMALAWLHKAGLEWSSSFAPLSQLNTRKISPAVIENMILTGVNSPWTSSIGRLFDAVSALTGVRQEVNYEGQAAIEFEALLDSSETGEYTFELLPPGIAQSCWIIDPTLALRQIVADLNKQTPVSTISAKFHNTISRMVSEMCEVLRRQEAISSVALSGGVWQNISLLKKTCTLLKNNGFKVYIHHLAPTNDGGISLGQATIARFNMKH